MQLFSNFATSLLTAGITDTETTITVSLTDGGLFQTPTTPQYELITLTDGVYWEVVKMVSKSGDTLTIERGHEGVSRAWPIDTVVKATVTKETLEQFLQREQIGASLNVFAYQNYR